MESEVKSWLRNILAENIDEYSIEVIGYSGIGDGYMSDILFVTLTPLKNKPGKKYDLVLKCSKRSRALRATTPVKQTFVTEICLYDKVIPTFTQFQLEKGITEPFNSIPKCYGTLIAEDMEIIVLENLKMRGYNLWDKRKPLTKQHMNLIVEEYAKFHSISVAVSEQNPRKFQELSEGLGDVMKEFLNATDLATLFGKNVLDIYDLLKGDLDESTLDTWRTLNDQVDFILDGMVDKEKGLKVVLHGDCWSNNFMFKHDSDGISPLQVAIFDWQGSRVSSPILDLSYFIFASISNEDVECISELVNHYYERLKFHCSQLGTHLEQLCSKKQFLDDWKRYSRLGILIGTFILKICTTESDDVVDLANAAEDGKDFSQAFSYDAKNKTAFKNRARNIVKYVVDNQLV